MLQISPTSITGCFRLKPVVRTDERGSLTKTFQKPFIQQNDLLFSVQEEYFTVSKKGVLRGLHFQVPPMDLVKLVQCISGKVLDVVVDLRADSPTYGKYELFELSGDNGDMVYIPSGLAHGFYTLTENATLLYKVSCVYSPECDKGILWNSVGIPWPDIHPQLSARDRSFPPLNKFETPFHSIPVKTQVSTISDESHSAIITGSTGFIGEHLTRTLLTQGWNVSVILRPESQLPVSLKDQPGLRIMRHDGTTKHLIQLLQGTKNTVVFHLASLFLAEHDPNTVEPLIRSNILFGTQLLEAMRTNGCSRLINAGTNWQHYKNEDYNPVCLYAATKQAFEAILRYYYEVSPLQFITLKLYDVYGPHDSRSKLFALLRAAAFKNSPLAMSPGEQTLDLVYIDDVVNAFILAGLRVLLSQQKVREEYAVSSGSPLRLQDIVRTYAKVTGHVLDIQWGGRPYRKREVMSPWNQGATLPGWFPITSLEEGIRKMEQDNEGKVIL